MTATARRIAVDLNPLLPGGANGGAATATLNLLGEFAARGRELLLFVLDSNAAAVEHLLGPTVERYIVRKDAITPRPTRSVDEWPHPWSLTRALGADVLYCPFGDPFWAEHGVPTVCTINDLQHLDHPEFFPVEEMGHRAEYLGRLAAVADHVVVPSDFTRQSVQKHLGLHAAITVVPYPAQRTWHSDGAEDDVPSEGMTERFLLYPANAWPHKNHDRLLRALALHKKRCAASGRAPIRLACTGSLLGRRSTLEHRVADLGLASLVDLLGHVSDADLRRLYRRAQGLVFPSLYEGFGLPVLEAMAFGTPVACSESGSLSEVGGDAVLYFDPLSPSAIADAIDVLAYDRAATTKLIERGRRQVATFTTERSVEAMLRVLDDMAGTATASVRVTKPSIAVVMPSFEQGGFIERSIDSVVAQGDVVSEFVVCDGGSTDGTVDVLECRRDVLEYVSEPDGGQASAVNKAIGKTSGDVIAWLNSDDVYYPGALDAVATVFAHHPELDWVFFASDHIGPDDQFIEPYYNRPWDAAAFRDSCFICQPGCFFRRSLILRVGPLDESLRYCMDYELWFRMSKVHAGVYVPVVTSGSRLHPETKTLGQRTKVLQETVDMLARLHGQASQWWLLGQVGDKVDQKRDWDLSDPVESRRRHRYALAEATRTFVRNRSMPEPATRSILLTWARASVGRPSAEPLRSAPARSLAGRLGAHIPPPARRMLSRPYHASTRWVRRRTMFELEPRLQAIERGVVAGHRAIEELRADMAHREEQLARRGNASLQLERVVFEHHQVEEALVDRLTAELALVREEIARLRASADDG
jgi:glycosyltransferase involved in cell wall biosynthesis